MELAPPLAPLTSEDLIGSPLSHSSAVGRQVRRFGVAVRDERPSSSPLPSCEPESRPRTNAYPPVAHQVGLRTSRSAVKLWRTWYVTLPGFHAVCDWGRAPVRHHLPIILVALGKPLCLVLGEFALVYLVPVPSTSRHPFSYQLTTVRRRCKR